MGQLLCQANGVSPNCLPSTVRWLAQQTKPESSDRCLHDYKMRGNLDRLPSSTGHGQQANSHWTGRLIAAILEGVYTGINTVQHFH